MSNQAGPLLNSEFNHLIISLPVEKLEMEHGIPGFCPFWNR